MEGRIKKIVTERGFGFISDLAGDSLFFHKSELKGVGFDELRVGDLVSFDQEETEKGRNAANVQRLEEGEKEQKEAEA